jgi:hypothetical protein
MTRKQKNNLGSRVLGFLLLTLSLYHVIALYIPLFKTSPAFITFDKVFTVILLVAVSGGAIWLLARSKRN